VPVGASGSVNANGCTGRGPGPTAGPLRGNEPVLIPMYAEMSRRSPPSRPFLNLLCPLCIYPCARLVRALLIRPLPLFGAFCSTSAQRCQGRHSQHPQALGRLRFGSAASASAPWCAIISTCRYGRETPIRLALHDGTGTNFALFSEVAHRVVLCLFDQAGCQSQVELPELDGFVWHGYLPRDRARQRYAYRVHGPHDGGVAL
jgi:predicted carbohydrate-binding protein with CBM48